VVELLGARRGQMLDMRSESGTTYIRYLVPTRGLLGFRARFLTATSGMGQLHSLFYGYEPLAGSIQSRQFGSLIAFEAGAAVAYGLDNAQLRGSLFIGPGVDVYEGMVVGEHIRPGDLPINVCKTKHLTNHRAKMENERIMLTPPRNLSLDDCIEFLAEDELLEVTPDSLRLRKRILDNELREKHRKARDKMVEEQLALSN
jgi:GTP-binding protein